MSIAPPTIVTIPAHTFEPAKRANPDGPGLVDDPMCGYHYRIDEEHGVFCGEHAEHLNHHGYDWEIRVREWTDEEIDRCNR